MADPTSDEMVIIREWVGTSMDSAMIISSWGAHGADINSTIEGLMNWQLTTLLSQGVDSISIEGALSMSTSGVINGLIARLKMFRDQGGVTGTSVPTSVSKLHRRQTR